jgi:hypothetical protein
LSDGATIVACGDSRPHSHQPASGFGALFVRGTLLEDRWLQSELPGYAE